MKRINLIFALLITVIAFFTSCEKEIVETEQDQKCSDILYFENDEEMFTELSHIISLNLDEKILWQDEKGVSSKGINADKLYKSIDPESFNSRDEIVQFVENNSDLLLLEEQDGEYSVETILKDNPFRYFMNEDHIFQVGEKYYKVFSNLRVGTSINNLDKLKDINDLNLKGLIHENDLEFCYLRDPSLKSASDCWNGITDRLHSEKIESDGGRYYRTWLTIYPMKYSIDNNEVAAISFGVGCQVRRLGIWFAHETTLYYTTNSVLEYTEKNVGLRRLLENQPYEYSGSSLNRKAFVIAAYGDVNFNPQPHLISYDYTVWSDAGVGPNGEGQVSVTCQ
jgi:hypothetical protein